MGGAEAHMNPAVSAFHVVDYIPALLPLLMAIAGWITLRLTQWLSLFPRRFIGIPPRMGWQGFFYARRDQFISRWSRHLLEKLGALDQIFEQIGPEKIVSHQLAKLRPQLDSFIDDVMNGQNQVLWENLPILVKNRFYARTHRLLPRIIDDIVEELGDNVRRIISYSQLIEFAEQDNPGTELRIYHALSRRAFRQLTLFCLYAGLAAGGVQLALTLPLHLLHHQTYWLVSGAAIGTAFFWGCQHWIESPRPTVQGWRLVWRTPLSRLRREQDRELATLLAETVLSPRNLARTLILGTRARHAQLIIKKRISPLLDDLNVRTFTQLTLGPIGFVNLKQALADKLTDSFLEPFDDEEFNQSRSKALTEFLHSRIEKQPDQLFYQQMKWILEPQAIAGTCVGFITGGMLGALQWLLLTL